MSGSGGSRSYLILLGLWLCVHFYF